MHEVRTAVLLVGVLSSFSAQAFIQFPSSPNKGAISFNRCLVADNSEVLCIGDMLYDCIAGDEALGWPIEKVVEKGAWKAWPGGAPANVACSLVKLGTRSAFAGSVGADADGDALKSLLEDTGVDTSLLRITAQAPTRRVMVSRTLEGDRQFSGFEGNKPAHAFADAFFDVRSVQTELPSALGGVKWLCTSTLSLAFPLSNEAFYAIVDSALAKVRHN